MQHDIPEKWSACLHCCEDLQTHEVAGDCWSQYFWKGSALGWRDFNVS